MKILDLFFPKAKAFLLENFSPSPAKTLQTPHLPALMQRKLSIVVSLPACPLIPRPKAHRKIRGHGGAEHGARVPEPAQLRMGQPRLGHELLALPGCCCKPAFFLLDLYFWGTGRSPGQEMSQSRRLNAKHQATNQEGLTVFTYPCSSSKAGCGCSSSSDQLLRFSFWEEKQETICPDVSPKQQWGGEACGSVLRFTCPRRLGCFSTASFLYIHPLRAGMQRADPPLPRAPCTPGQSKRPCLPRDSPIAAAGGHQERVKRRWEGSSLEAKGRKGFAGWVRQRFQKPQSINNCDKVVMQHQE